MKAGPGYQTVAGHSYWERLTKTTRAGGPKAARTRVGTDHAPPFAAMIPSDPEVFYLGALGSSPHASPALATPVQAGTRTAHPNSPA